MKRGWGGGRGRREGASEEGMGWWFGKRGSSSELRTNLCSGQGRKSTRIREGAPKLGRGRLREGKGAHIRKKASALGRGHPH